MLLVQQSFHKIDSCCSKTNYTRAYGNVVTTSREISESPEKVEATEQLSQKK
jgi:hypothetical protein